MKALKVGEFFDLLLMGICLSVKTKTEGEDNTGITGLTFFPNGTVWWKFLGFLFVISKFFDISY